MRAVVTLLALMLVALVGCDSTADTPLQVAEAASGDHDGEVQVVGFIVTVPNGTVFLSEALAESFPPQPGGTRIEVLGLDLGGITDLKTEQSVSWTDDTIEVSGNLSNGVLTASG